METPMTEQTKTFPLRVVLSVTTGRLLTEQKGPRDNGIGDIHQLLGWMANDQPFTHQLPRFGRECAPWLLKWFPELGDVNLGLLDDLMRVEGDSKGVEAWLESAVLLAKCKASYDVPRIPGGHEHRDPVEELAEMSGKVPVVLVIREQQT